MNTLIRFSLTALLALIVTSFTQAGDKITYYHNDALGSPVAATNQLGQVIWRETYKPYGERTTKAAANTNNTVWFTGKPEESALGINYFGAHWYHPEAGRFLVIDPAGVAPQNIHSFNRYSYANNNPYTYVDPTGGIVETAWDALNIGLGVASFVNNARQGNYGAAAVDAAGIAVDGAAAAFPFIPGGAGSAIKAARGIDDAVDAARGAADGERAGKVFTKAGKNAVKADNATAHGGQTTCSTCGQPTIPAKQSRSGETHAGNETHVDHIIPRSKNGNGSPDNGQVLCRTCNLKKGNN